MYVRRAALAKELSLTPQGFSKFLKRMPSFPKGVKLGNEKQAAVIFDRAAVDAWLKQAQRVN